MLSKRNLVFLLYRLSHEEVHNGLVLTSEQGAEDEIKAHDP